MGLTPDTTLGDDNELLGSEKSVKEMHRSAGIVPMLEQPESEMLNLREAKMHNKRMVELERYLVLVENPQDVTQFTAPKLLAQLSYGFRKSGEYLALAQYAYKRARAERKQAEAVAALDNIRDYVLQQKNKGVDVKITDAVRSHYIQIDPEVKRT